MCHEVVIDDTECNNVGELRRFCPKIVGDKSYPAITNFHCLCCVDIQATAAANGFECETLDGDGMRHSFRRKS